MRVLKLQNLCSTLKIHIYGIERNPKTRASYWSFIQRAVLLWSVCKSSHCRGLKTVWWICKTLKKIQRSFSNRRCHRPHQIKSHPLQFLPEFPVFPSRDNSQNASYSHPHKTLYRSEHDALGKLGIWLFWEHPWTYVKALAAKKLCGFFLMQLSRLCEELTLLVMRCYELVCGKREHSFST